MGRSGFQIPGSQKRKIKKLRPVIYKESLGICVYCNSKLNLEDSSIDHIIPMSKGGNPTDIENLVCCCADCNNRKSSYDLIIFLARSFKLKKPFPKKFSTTNDKLLTEFNKRLELSA